MATIKTMNNISKKGLSLFGSFYQVSDSVEKPDAILVRSAQVDTDNFDGLLAVARAGARMPSWCVPPRLIPTTLTACWLSPAPALA